LLAASE